MSVLFAHSVLTIRISLVFYRENDTEEYGLGKSCADPCDHTSPEEQL